MTEQHLDMPVTERYSTTLLAEPVHSNEVVEECVDGCSWVDPPRKWNLRPIHCRVRKSHEVANSVIAVAICRKFPDLVAECYHLQ